MENYFGLIEEIVLISNKYLFCHVMAVFLSLHCVWEYEDQLEILQCFLTGTSKSKVWV